MRRTRIAKWRAPVKRSTDRILTTHVGSLPEPASLDHAAADYPQRLRQQVAEVVNKQRAIGLDVINEGEYTKGGDWLSYIDGRLGGFEERPPKGGTPVLLQGKDREEFADFYRYASERGTLFYSPVAAGGQIRTRRPHWAATAPIFYRGQAALAREIELFRTLVTPAEAFLTSTAPASFEPYRDNEFYKSEESSYSRSPRRCAPSTRPSRRRASSCRSTTPGCRRCGTASAS